MGASRGEWARALAGGVVLAALGWVWFVVFLALTP